MRKTLTALALTATLISQPALLDSFWTFLSSLWEESTPDAGCGADPSGRCNPQPQIDEGCGADPSGCPKGS
jgi:hypothetical protein